MLADTSGELRYFTGDESAESTNYYASAVIPRLAFLSGDGGGVQFSGYGPEETMMQEANIRHAQECFAKSRAHHPAMSSYVPVRISVNGDGALVIQRRSLCERSVMQPHVYTTSTETMEGTLQYAYRRRDPAETSGPWTGFYVPGQAATLEILRETTQRAENVKYVFCDRVHHERVIDNRLDDIVVCNDWSSVADMSSQGGETDGRLPWVIINTTNFFNAEARRQLAPGDKWMAQDGHCYVTSDSQRLPAAHFLRDGRALAFSTFAPWRALGLGDALIAEQPRQDDGVERFVPFTADAAGRYEVALGRTVYDLFGEGCVFATEDTDRIYHFRTVAADRRGIREAISPNKAIDVNLPAVQIKRTDVFGQTAMAKIADIKTIHKYAGDATPRLLPQVVALRTTEGYLLTLRLSV